MKEDKSTHPYLTAIRSSNRKRQALWNTNAGFPLSHLTDSGTLEDPPPAAPVYQDEPVVQTLISLTAPVQDSAGLSPFTKWLLSHKPVSPIGTTPEVTHLVVHGPVEEAPHVESKKKKKKKKDKKDKKKKKKKRKKAAKSGKHGGKPGVLDTGLVTDILAELTAEQGHFRDAIEMYRRLVNLHPERTAYYLEKIQALRSEDSDE